MNLTASLSSVPKIGKTYEKRLKKLGITTVRDLLFHFPNKYQDLSQITPIAQIKEGGNYCVVGKILDIQNVRTFKKRMNITSAIIEDKTGSIKIVWFNQPYLTTALKKGTSVYIVGKVTRGKNEVSFSSPSYEKFSEESTHAGRIIPVYPETIGVSSRWLRYIIKPLLDKLPKNIEDALPKDMLQERNLMPFDEALLQIHFPSSLAKAELAKKRFAFEELFFISLFVLTERKKLAAIKAISIPFLEANMQKFTKALSFQLTGAQKKAAWYILKDLEKPRPMNRLLQGDVGSGKTVVAAMAALSVVKAGYQAAFMAPTEILAQQHFKTIGQILAPFKVTVGLLTGKTDRFISPKLPNDYIEISREKLLDRAKKGDINLLIGTHALIQDKVKFGNLALVVVDEQHRFGVKQRAKLVHNSSTSSRHALIPHLLSMTATPIPRTLALTIYGDLDLVLIDELPKGRKKIETKIIPPTERQKAYEFIHQQVEEGRQVFVICPRIEKTEGAPSGIEMKTVKEEYEKLSKKVFPDLEVEMLHGKMPQKEKERIMRKFKYGRIDILVNNAGITISEPSESYSEENWERTYQVNLKAAFLLSQAVAKYMIEQKSGVIINVTSIGAEQGFPENPAYVAFKGGLKQLTKALARDWAIHNIRVNNLGPGYIRTSMTVKSWDTPESRQARSEKIMLER
ncbi:SDR family NAD(P)-dependent oxidoreductase, partial [Patescibacteria group bacterium]|nr:SDR family NAD(P)-dependent oxidoreductase [Patescibacteria group bacterium]